jgi:hypothetical protein
MIKKELRNDAPIHFRSNFYYAQCMGKCRVFGPNTRHFPQPYWTVLHYYQYYCKIYSLLERESEPQELSHPSEGNIDELPSVISPVQYIVLLLATSLIEITMQSKLCRKFDSRFKVCRISEILTVVTNWH